MRIINLLHNLYVNSSNERKCRYLIKHGATIGKNTRLNCKIKAFGTEPYLISVGEDCLFATDIRFITHDGGIKVLNSLGKFNGKRMDKISPIICGNNVYIGTGAYIMPGVQIGDNCIIGAGAIVTKDIPQNSVAVGIPAKVICSIDTYYDNLILRNSIHPTADMSFTEKKKYYKNLYKNTT